MFIVHTVRAIIVLAALRCQSQLFALARSLTRALQGEVVVYKSESMKHSPSPSTLGASALAAATATAGAGAGSVDVKEVNRYKPGDYFGERSALRCKACLACSH